MVSAKIFLYRLLQSERALAQLDDATVPEGVLTYKHATMHYQKKDGTVSEYHYSYPYLRVGKKQRYLKPEERARICPVMQVRELLRLIKKAIQTLIHLIFFRLPGPEQPKEEDLRAAYYQAAQAADRHRAEKKAPAMPEEYLSAQGDRMQSREECMTADNLYAMGIPYKYEPKLLTPNGKYEYRNPDFEVFTFQKSYYMEVMGMVDSPEYEAKISQKLLDYEKVGVKSGKNLLIFRNTQRYGIDGKTLWETISKSLEEDLPKGMIYI